MKTFYVVLYLAGQTDPQVIAATDLEQCLSMTRKAEANSNEAWCIIDDDTKIPVGEGYDEKALYDPKSNPEGVAKAQ